MEMKVNFPSFIMLGTVHRDPRGYSKLFKFLERECPDIVTVEISPYARTFRSQHGKALRSTLRDNLRKIEKEEALPLRDIIFHGEILAIYLLLQEPYEWRAAKVYAEAYGKTIQEMDLSTYSEEKLSHLEELISLNNLMTLLRTPHIDLKRQVQLQYLRADFLFSHPPSTWETTKEMKEREAYMAQGIRNRIGGGRGEKIIHIGGWEHLIDSPKEKTLFGLLKDLQPRRALLS
jgi:hypothetical protein